MIQLPLLLVAMWNSRQLPFQIQREDVTLVNLCSQENSCKGNTSFFLGVINMVIINAQKVLQVSILSAPTPLIPGSCDRGPAHYWSTSFLPLPATLKSLVLCQRFGAVAENWAPCGGEPFFFSKGGEHELQKHPGGLFSARVVAWL